MKSKKGFEARFKRGAAQTQPELFELLDDSDFSTTYKRSRGHCGTRPINDNPSAKAVTGGVSSHDILAGLGFHVDDRLARLAHHLHSRALLQDGRR